jgi:hypothetical protein
LAQAKHLPSAKDRKAAAERATYYAGQGYATMVAEHVVRDLLVGLGMDELETLHIMVS